MSAKPQSDQWRFAAISCGRDHTLAVLENGAVFGWGGDGSGRMPSGAPQYCSTPASRIRATEVRTDVKVATVSAGYGVSLGITAHGKVSIWGANASGIAGRLDAIQPAMPQLLPGFAGMRGVAAGEFQFGAVDQAGKLYTWGLNVEGALGRTVGQLNAAPGVVTDLPPIAQVAVGRGHMLALDEDGMLHAWGGNGAGQLGLGHLSSAATPQASRWPQLRYDAVAAGTSHSLGLSVQGQVYAWGSNHHGQLGRRAPDYATEPLLVRLPEPVTAIAAGMHFSVAVGASGKVYAWGWNGHGQLGVGDLLDRHAPAQVKYLKHASAIAAGETHVVAMTPAGLFGWGGNASGQLGEAERRQRFAVQLI
jgi:alpha-tubulin suppressor-like RCC1 family protein